MKLKTKILSVVIITLFTAFLLGMTNEVKAAEITEEYLQSILDVLPSKISVDLKETEYDKASDIISQKVKEIWKENGVDVKDLENQVSISINANAIYLSQTREDFTQCYISMSSKKPSSHIWKSREIDLEYNNSNKYNTSDEQYVKSFKLTSPKYYEVDIDFLNNNENGTFYNIISEYCEKKINDKSISVMADTGAGGTDGGLNLWTWESGTSIGIFKNDILYNIVRMGQECTVPVINIPSNIKDNDINDYIISEITKHYKEFGEKITKIEKGTSSLEVNIPNGYTIKSDYADTIDSYVIVKREVSSIDVVNKETNIKLEADTTVVPEGTILETKEIKDEKILNTIKENLKEISNKFVTYDITLKSDNVVIQPNGKVKISIPIPNGFDTSNLKVYRIANDGTKTEYNVKVNGNYATFETDHFSTYALAEVKPKDTNDNTNTENTNKEKDTTPKTGVTSPILFVALATVIAGISIVAVKKKQK